MPIVLLRRAFGSWDGIRFGNFPVAPERCSISALRTMECQRIRDSSFISDHFTRHIRLPLPEPRYTHTLNSYYESPNRKFGSSMKIAMILVTRDEWSRIPYVNRVETAPNTIGCVWSSFDCLVVVRFGMFRPRIALPQ